MMTTKRPRIDTESPTSSTSAIGSESSIVSPQKPRTNTAATTASAPPQLDEIPRLLLVELLKTNASDVTQALEGLKDLFHRDEKHRNDGMDMGAAGIISMAMHKFPTELEVQANACTCLCWLTFQPRQRNACAITARSGGLEMLVKAMRTFRDVDFLNGDACSALANIFATDDDSHDMERAAKSFVEHCQGLKLIKETMEHYPDYAHLQSSCCALLCHLAQPDETFHEEMNDLGLVAQAAAALEHHYTDDSVKRNANIFIKLMLSG